MNECLGFGLVFLVVGSIMPLLSLTKAGRHWTRGHNRLPLATQIRTGPSGDFIANVLVACAGTAVE